MHRRASHPSLPMDASQGSCSYELAPMSSPNTPQTSNTQQSRPRVQRPAPVFFPARGSVHPVTTTPDGQGEDEESITDDTPNYIGYHRAIWGKAPSPDLLSNSLKSAAVDESTPDPPPANQENMDRISWGIKPATCQSPTLRALVSGSSLSDPFKSPSSTPQNIFDRGSSPSDSGSSQSQLKAIELTCSGIDEWKAENFSSRAGIDSLIAEYPLPAAIAPIGPVAAEYKKLAKRVSHYLFLMALFLTSNLISLIAVLVVYKNEIFTYNFAYVCATAGTIDLSLTVFMRHENVINLAFYLISKLVPRSAPVSIRSLFAKSPYSLGGIHAGCACGAVLWQTLQTTVLLKYHNEHGFKGLNIPLSILSLLTLAGLWIITITSIPRIRNKYHKQWEFIHRWGGYFTILTVWPQTFMTALVENKDGNSAGMMLIHSPTFWCLILILIPIFYPWIWLRRVSFYFEKNVWTPGSCQLYFRTAAPIKPVVAIRMARGPFAEYHAFATIPFPNKEPGFAVFMSGLGDWTQEFIKNPPEHVWTRGAPTHGVLRIAPMFKRMLFIATGSGIGPVLSALNVYHEKLDFHLIWMDTNPWERHGPYVTRQVLNFRERATIVDKTMVGKGVDLVTFGWAAKMRLDAEAVAIISGPGATKTVTSAFESRGVPCFGAIFDS